MTVVICLVDIFLIFYDFYERALISSTGLKHKHYTDCKCLFAFPGIKGELDERT